MTMRLEVDHPRDFGSNGEMHLKDGHIEYLSFMERASASAWCGIFESLESKLKLTLQSQPHLPDAATSCQGQ
jgi:hypothetical protein